MRISNYSEFISESKLELLLEANISYTENFKSLLSKLKSPVAKNLLDLIGKDIDVPTNYIDVMMDKEDSVSFVPDNRAVKAKIVVKPGLIYSGLVDIVLGDKEKCNKIGLDPNSLPGYPTTGDKVTKIRELTHDELSMIYQSDMNWDSILSGYKMLLIHFISSSTNSELCTIIRSDGIAESKDLVDGPRSEIKIGRLARRILDKAGIKPTDKEIEEFVNEYKSRIQIEKDVFRNIEIVSGDAIAEWYYEGKYLPSNGGTLGSSCMRYSKCRSYFGIYTNNPNQVSLVILKTEPGEVNSNPLHESEPLLKGRALLWTDTKGRKFMDRVYTNKDSDINIFIQYAQKNGWLYKKHQENDECTPLMLNGEQVSSDDQSVVVELEKKGEYSRYPYLDTLKFYNVYDGKLTNDESFSFDYKLEDTSGGNGSCDECGGSGRVECGDCDGSGETTCSSCDGDGNNRCGECGGSGRIDQDGEEVDCPDCDGDGEIECSDCGGSGEEECHNCYGRGTVDCYECS